MENKTYLIYFINYDFMLDKWRDYNLYNLVNHNPEKNRTYPKVTE